MESLLLIDYIFFYCKVEACTQNIAKLHSLQPQNTINNCATKYNALLHVKNPTNRLLNASFFPYNTTLYGKNIAMFPYNATALPYNAALYG